MRLVWMFEAKIFALLLNLLNLDKFKQTENILQYLDDLKIGTAIIKQSKLEFCIELATTGIVASQKSEIDKKITS